MHVRALEFVHFCWVRPPDQTFSVDTADPMYDLAIYGTVAGPAVEKRGIKNAGQSHDISENKGK